MDVAFDMFGDAASTMLTLLVFMATAILAFAVMASVRLHGSMKRRAASSMLGVNCGTPDTMTVP